MIDIPLSQIGSPEAFAAALEQHRADLEAHRLGKPGKPVPLADELVDALILRVPDQGPVATRGPDKFVIAEYRIIDDTPPPALPSDQQRALDTLRETLAG